MILLLSQIYVWNTVRLRKHLNRTGTGTEPSGFLIFRQKCVWLKNHLFGPARVKCQHSCTFYNFNMMMRLCRSWRSGQWVILVVLVVLVWPAGVVSDLCGTRTRNFHPKHILQTQSSVLVPEPNPAAGSVSKVGSTVIRTFIVVVSLLWFLIVLFYDVVFTAPPSVPADADPPQVPLLSKQMNEPDLRRSVSSSVLVLLQARQLELLTTVSCYWIG